MIHQLKTLAWVLSCLAMIATIVVAFTTRLYKIESIPYGYHVDELASSVSAQCLATEGIDAHNNPHPIFFQTNYGSPRPPTYMYPAAVWGKVFGFTIASLRAYGVCVYFLGVIGLFFLGRVFFGTTFGLWVAFIGAISPWNWATSRVAIESLFAPTFSIWALYFFFRRPLSHINWALAGMLFTASMYSYPAMRLQVPMMLVTLGIYGLIKMKPRFSLWVALFLGWALPLIPLALKIVNGELQQRFNEINISAPAYLQSLGKTDSFRDIFGIFLTNFKLHLSPNFLVRSGDPSLIHSLGHFGILSWLDVAGLIVCALWLVVLVIKPLRPYNPWTSQTAFLILLLANIFLGIVPSAITNSEIPHSIRVVGGWPFLCLLAGYFLYDLQKRFWPLGVAAVVGGVLFFAAATKSYFGPYQQDSKGMFGYWTLEQVRAAKTEEDWQKFMLMYSDQDYHVRYFLIQAHGGETCLSAKMKWDNLRAALRVLGH